MEKINLDTIDADMTHDITEMIHLLIDQMWPDDVNEIMIDCINELPVPTWLDYFTTHLLRVVTYDDHHEPDLTRLIVFFGHHPFPELRSNQFLIRAVLGSDPVAIRKYIWSDRLQCSE